MTDEIVLRDAGPSVKIRSGEGTFGPQRPSIVYVMADDHASHAISAYGSRINETPNIDRLAAEGMRFDNCFCTNALCTPSRATILTGQHSHVNGVSTLVTLIDNRLPTFAGLLQEEGYQTAIVGKWHLGHGPGHDPKGFDYWNVLPKQGRYHDPELIENGTTKTYQGYVTDIITDEALRWLDQRDEDRPFCLLVHHKAPHGPWQPAAKHAHMYEDVDIPEPETLYDDYSNRSEAAEIAGIRINRDMRLALLKDVPVPEGLSADEELAWKYQRYIKDYLRCVASVDDNVGRMLDYLDKHGLTDDTVFVYTSDQGFFLGDHGWYDKRFMYEESLRMPLLVRYPGQVEAGSTADAMVLNLDFAQTLLDLAGVPELPTMQGRSFASALRGETPGDWRQSMYYRYQMHGDAVHHIRGHFGVRTHRHKLIHYNGKSPGVPGSSDQEFEPEWELFDLAEDPRELNNVYDDPAYTAIRNELTEELDRVQREAGDMP